VIWIGNDQNEQAGLYGATGAMKVWSGIFARLPSAPLKVNGKGLDWQWVEASGSGTTDVDCPGARQFPFVAGFIPAYVPCSAAAAPAEEAGSEQGGGGWRSWFGLDRKESEPAPSSPPPEK